MTLSCFVCSFPSTGSSTLPGKLTALMPERILLSYIQEEGVQVSGLLAEGKQWRLLLLGAQGWVDREPRDHQTQLLPSLTQMGFYTQARSLTCPPNVLLHLTKPRFSEYFFMIPRR